MVFKMVLIFKRGQLVRLDDLPNNTEYNGELARVASGLDESDGSYEVALQQIIDDDNDDVVAFDMKFLGHVREPPGRAK